MPQRCIATRVPFSSLSMVIWDGLITDCIDLTTHLQRVSSDVSQGEIHGTACAVGWRSGWVSTGWGPEPGHLPLHLLKR